MTEPRLGGVHRTAIGAACMRALHLLQDGEPKILRDEFALPLSGVTAEQLLATAKSRQIPDSTATWVVRSRLAEDRVEEGYARGIHQYVVLGAGLDSFALRSAPRFPALRVFEVDDPPMQGWKQRRLAELGLAVPSALRFAPCDFEKESVADALARAGFEAHRPALVSWLGVTQYLTRQAIRETLRWAASLAPGSEFVLTYCVPGPEAEATKAEHARQGVRFETFFRPEEIVSALTEAGFAQIEALTPDWLERRYFAGRSDGLHAPAVERLVSGRVP